MIRWLENSTWVTHLCLPPPPHPAPQYISLLSLASQLLGSHMGECSRYRVCPPFHHTLRTPERTYNGCIQATQPKAIPQRAQTLLAPSGHKHSHSSPLRHPRDAAASTIEVQPLCSPFPPPASAPHQVFCHSAGAQEIKAQPECMVLRDTQRHNPRTWAGQPDSDSGARACARGARRNGCG